MSAERAEDMIEAIYETNDGRESMEDYHQRHGIESLAILTIASAYAATREVDQFAHQIRGKIVIEIGAGVGFLAIEMARFAKQVYAIEADPAWTWVFTDSLYEVKPPNLTWIFGAAESVSSVLRGDVAVIFTRSGQDRMEEVARTMCPEVIWGPSLSLEERYIDVPPEIRDEAARAAANLTPADLISRRGFKTGASAGPAKEGA